MTRLATCFLAVLLVPLLAVAQPTVDGDLSDANYQTVATKQNANASFGGAINVEEIRAYTDMATSTLYIGLIGTLDTGNNNGIGVWLNVAGVGSPTGRAAGDTLGVQGGGHYIGGNGGANGQFKADFEVDVMYAMNSGGTSSDVYFDAASVTGPTPSTVYVGNSDQSGTAATGTGPGGEIITWAVDNSGGAETGVELQIPLAELGATTSNSIEVMAMVVSSSAFFSNVTVPGNYTGGSQPGFDADFGSFSGGPYHAGPAPLPVELSTFAVAADGAQAVLNWSTATETNNAGFGILHAAGDGSFEEIGFVGGAGTVDTPQAYRFKTGDLAPGVHRFRLAQRDLDGTETLSEPKAMRVRPVTSLDPVYPNPAAGMAKVTFEVETAAPVTVSLYNTLGQKVRTLFDGTASVGETTVSFATDRLAPGLYLVRMNGAGVQTTQRVTVMR